MGEPSFHTGAIHETFIERNVSSDVFTCRGALGPLGETTTAKVRPKDDVRTVVAALCPSIPETTTGTLLTVVVPSPNAPRKLLPQQRAVPSMMTAQEWDTPTPMPAANHVSPTPSMPETLTGNGLLVVEPSPN
jgi:hypothetical protein